MSGLTGSDWVNLVSAVLGAISVLITMTVKAEVSKLRAEVAESYLSKTDFDRLSRIQKEH